MDKDAYKRELHGLQIGLHPAQSRRILAAIDAVAALSVPPEQGLGRRDELLSRGQAGERLA